MRNPIASAPIDVTIELRGREADWWAIDMQVNNPDEDTEISAAVNESPVMQLDVSELDGLAPKEYGELLTERLFAPDVIRDEFSKARAAADLSQRSLRLRLRIAADAPQLHAVHWETLRDPADDETILALQERIVFSRWLDSRDWRSVSLRAKTQLRALVAVAGPTPGTMAEDFAEVDVAGEIERAKAGLGFASVTTLGEERPFTLEALVKELQEAYDIVYLVAHGFISRGIPRIILQDNEGDAKPVKADEFIGQLHRVITLPRLMILGSCQSGGGDSSSQDGGALAALGPRLAQLGVPAVVGMQGNVSLNSIADFVPAMFASLERDGFIDRAVSVGRNAIRDRADWWLPVLYLRLKSGRVWYTPSFSGSPVTTWRKLRTAIEGEKCTPILGPGLTDSLIGTRKEIARTWATKWGFPSGPPSDEDLPRVAQYVEKQHSEGLLREELRQFIGNALTTRYRDKLEGDLDADYSDPVKLDRLICQVGSFARQNREADSHDILARMNVPAYITTQPSSLLTDALSAHDRDPIVDYFRWSDDDIDWPALGATKPEDVVGTNRHPLVYHLFGHLKFDNSVVLTEDDYFDFLRAIGGEQRKAIPHQLLERLVGTSLLFVGFRMDEWDFRVLFRGLMNLQGERHSGKWEHVAVQLDPEESLTTDPEQARRYFEQYFGTKFSIYWGGPDEFLGELNSELKESLLVPT